MNGVGEFLRFPEVRSGCFAPQHIRVGRVRQTPRDSRVNSAAVLIKTFGRALTVDEFTVMRIGIRKQKTSRVGIRARDENRRHAANVGGQPRRHKFLDEFPCGHDNFTAQVAAFLRG